MRAIVLLADSAQVDAQQKVHALGQGWTITSTPTPAAAVCVFILVPWTATNQKHRFTLRLVDSDGQDVAGAEGQLLRIEGEFEMGRPPGTKPGGALTQPFVLNVPPGLALSAGESYAWRMDIDGHHDEDWSAQFTVRDQQ